jgi:hypothetical protein
MKVGQRCQELDLKKGLDIELTHNEFWVGHTDM